jgi:hypothetical protein
LTDFPFNAGLLTYNQIIAKVGIELFCSIRVINNLPVKPFPSASVITVNFGGNALLTKFYKLFGEEDVLKYIFLRSQLTAILPNFHPIAFPITAAFC